MRATGKVPPPSTLTAAGQKCFLICNAHLDPVWLWTWEEGLTEAISTFRVAADFCDQYPDFVFNHNESLLYEWVERNDPELFLRIQEHVKAKRWQITGGSYIQPDLIAPSGESVIRHYLIGKGYFQEKFGIDPTTAYNFDTFGHPQGLIQILQGCGMDSYVFCRPARSVLPLPVGSFIWRHASGAEVIARRSDDHYITQGDLLKNIVDGKWGEYHKEEGDFMFLWGIGNHGGGPSHAEYADLKKLPDHISDLEFIESTPEAFFKHSLGLRDRGALAVVTGDFKPVFEGCYTSMQALKMRHRRLENLMATVEKYSAIAWWRNKRDYPAADLTVAWKDILFAEFHDLVTGSGIEKVEQDGLNLLGHAEEILRRRRAEVLISLLRDEPIAERNETPIFVFNPHPWEVTQEVEIDFGIDRQFSLDGVVRRLLENGKEIPAQFEKPDENLWNKSWGEWRSRAVFLTTIPALSYRRFDSDYTLVPAKDIKRWQTPALPEGDVLRIKTDCLLVDINLNTGLIDRVECDGLVALTAGSCRPLVFDDINHSWSTYPEWREPAANFDLASPKRTAEIIGSAHTHRHFPEGKPPISILEDGPARIVVEAILVSGTSYIAQRYVVSKNRPVIQVEQTVFWAEHDRMLRLELVHDCSLKMIEAEKCYSIDDETASSADGSEKDFQRFLRFSDGADQAFAVVSHGTNAFSHKDGRVRLGILRSPSYATIEQNIGPEFDRYLNRYIPRQEQGIRHATFTLLFGSQAATTEATARAAYECNVPLDPFIYFPTRRVEKPKAMSFASTDAPNVLLTVIKKAENGESLILRLWETGGKATQCHLALEGNRFPVAMGPWQLKTFRLDRNGSLTECDLIERPFSSGPNGVLPE